MSGAAASERTAPRSAVALVLLALAAIGAFAGLFALGTWQLERRAWKHELVARVEERVHAAPVAAPGPAEWPLVSAARDEYRRVRVAGTFLHDRAALVQAATALGAGHWVLTPLRTADGSIVLVNRGFVSPEHRAQALRGDSGPPAGGEVVVTGLLRLTEPGGGFLRRNDPAADRWHSRDVQAIAASRNLAGVAPYFIDAGAPPGAAPGEGDTGPVPGLTVTAFSDSHLVYALTWYALAAMVALGAGHVARVEARQRRGAGRHAARPDGDPAPDARRPVAGAGGVPYPPR